jgi:hypothetical protein
MARKRSFSDNDSGNTMVLDSGNMLDQHQHQQQASQQKRCCGTAQNPAPGELKSDEVATYLHNLSAHLSSSQLEHASTVLSTEGWQVRTLPQNLHMLSRFCVEYMHLESKVCCNKDAGAYQIGPRLPASSTAVAAGAEHGASAMLHATVRAPANGTNINRTPLETTTTTRKLTSSCHALHLSRQAFAELNILLSSCLSSRALPDQLLRSYSRFTLQPRAELWGRYSTYAAAKANLSPQELQLLRFLLEWVLAL